MLAALYRLCDSLRHQKRRNLWTHEHAAGRQAEDLAHRYLRSRGYTIVARNYRPRAGAGELDLIAWDGNTLAIIEVKARHSEKFGAPDLAVGPEKQESVRKTAREYARRARVDWERVRFDIVSVVLADSPRIELHKDAFLRAAG